MSEPLGRKFSVGAQVVISQDYYWAKGATGTISGLEARVVEMIVGPVQFYFVDFDVPQDDGSGDGPYRKAEIDSRFITHA